MKPTSLLREWLMKQIRNILLAHLMPSSEIEEKRRVLLITSSSSWDPEVIYTLDGRLAYRLEKQ